MSQIEDGKSQSDIRQGVTLEVFLAKAGLWDDERLRKSMI
jgi:hypothetical protein